MTVDQRGLSKAKDRLALSHSQNLLFDVAGWELRRLSVRIWSWAAVAASFLFFLGIVYFKHAWTIPAAERSLAIVMGTSGIGLLLQFINVLLLVLALMLPFVVTDGVARDYKQRIHEVFMTTPVPTWAYIWGRFLAILCVSLGLAVLTLVADIVMGNLLAQQHPDIPAPDVVTALLVWAVVMLPATIFLTGVGFTLGTLWPRRSTTMMLAMVVAWVLWYVLGNVLFNVFNHLFMYLDPSSLGILGAVYVPFMQMAKEVLTGVPPDQVTKIMLKIQGTLPDLTPWLLPHYGLAVFGMVLVGVAAARFKRFRDVLS